MSGRVQPGRGIAAVLRVGTLAAVACIGAGFVAVLVVGDPGPGPRPVVELLGGGGADALIGAGLLALVLIPVVALAVAVPSLVRAGERGRAITAIAVVGLLLASLVAAALVGSVS